MRLAGWIFALLLWPQAARAEWLEASGTHFVVYADESEDEARRFADRLERYHAAMELLTRQKTPALSPSNRLTVYVVKNVEEVRELARSDMVNLDAFYRPRAEGSLAVVPSQGGATDRESEHALRVLLHEYAHHFLRSTGSFPMPLWFSEGAAEFFASASFEAGGGVELGLPANHRLRELAFARQITARDVLFTVPGDGIGSNYAGFYAKSWQLYHYLIFESRRQGQLARYVAELTAGTNQRDAARRAFGDLAALERELDDYGKRRKLLSFVVPPGGLRPGPVTVRALTPGAASAMPVRLRLRLGARGGQSLALLTQARTIAARFPNDPAVLATLAAADYGVGNNEGAVAAADAAIAADPAQVDGYVQKGLALFRMAERSGTPEAFVQARAAFAALSGREPDNPVPLIYAFHSYLAQGQSPPPLAMQGMQRAVDLAPFDLTLRMTLARQQMRLGQEAAARANLLPVAYNPHGGPLAAEARAALARLTVQSGSQGSGVEDPKASDGGAPTAAKSLH